jgi:hypothetical protein
MVMPVVLLVAGATAFGFAEHVFVVTSDGASGNTAALAIDPPWTPLPDLEPIGGEAIVRHFFGKHYVVNRDVGTIQVIDPATFETIVEFSVGAASRPQDILVVGRHQAYVSRHESAVLLEVDPTDGAVKDTIDLGAFADADGLPEMSMMALDGKHLFVQIQRLDRRASMAPVVPSYLAVVDVSTNQLVDVAPAIPGLQAIRLTGLVPSFKMFVEPETRRLYVSEPADFCCEHEGGIDEIDLDLLRALGHVTTEQKLQTLDLGAFTMISADEGYAVTHTEIVESTHVTAFSRETGAPTGQAYTTLFGSVRSLAHDPETSQVFFPDFTNDGTIGVVVFDSTTDETLTRAPIDAGGPPTDLVIVRPVSPGEARDLRVESFDRTTGRMSLRYEPACGAADHLIVFGPLDQVGSYAYAGQDCGIGNLGAYDAFEPGPGSGSLFFLIVGTDGESTEGSYGTDSAGAERPEDLADPLCALEQELAFRCDP